MNNARGHVLILVLFGAVMMLPTATYPLGEDQAIFGYVARRMSEGGVLYRDVWDHKLSIYFLYAGIFRLLADSATAIRAFDCAWQLVTALSLYGLARRMTAPTAAVASAMAYVMFYADSSYWGMAQPDGFANLFVTLALLCWTNWAEEKDRPRRAAWWALLGGVLLGGAMTLRPTLVVIAALIVLLGWQRQRPASAVVSALWLSSIGAGFALLPFIGYFAARSALADFIETFVLINAKYSALGAGSCFTDAANGIVVGLAHANRLVLVCGFLGMLHVLSRCKEDRRCVVLVSFWLLTILSVTVQRKFFSYHWIVTFPPFAIIAGSVAELRGQFDSLPAARRRRTLTPLFVLGTLLAGEFGVRLTMNYVELLRPKPTWAEWRAHYARFGPEPGKAVTPYSFRFDVEADAARYIAARTEPDDPILVWGFSPLVYYLAHRNAPTRFFDPKVLFWEGVPADWRVEYLATLRERPPRYLVVHHGDLQYDPTDRLNTDPFFQLRRPPLEAMEQFVRVRYVEERRFGYLTLFRRPD